MDFGIGLDAIGTCTKPEINQDSPVMAVSHRISPFRALDQRTPRLRLCWTESAGLLVAKWGRAFVRWGIHGYRWASMTFRFTIIAT
jgi:hypothetical protein